MGLRLGEPGPQVEFVTRRAGNDDTIGADRAVGRWTRSRDPIHRIVPPAMVAGSLGSRVYCPPRDSEGTRMKSGVNLDVSPMDRSISGASRAVTIPARKRLCIAIHRKWFDGKFLCRVIPTSVMLPSLHSPISWSFARLKHLRSRIFLVSISHQVPGQNYCIGLALIGISDLR